MPNKNKTTVENIRHKFYGKDEHNTLKGHTIQMDVYFLQDNAIKKEHIILTQKDLVITALKKLEYFQNK